MLFATMGLICYVSFCALCTSLYFCLVSDFGIGLCLLDLIIVQHNVTKYTTLCSMCCFGFPEAVQPLRDSSLSSKLTTQTMISFVCVIIAEQPIHHLAYVYGEPTSLFTPSLCACRPVAIYSPLSCSLQTSSVHFC